MGTCFTKDINNDKPEDNINNYEQIPQIVDPDANLHSKPPINNNQANDNNFDIQQNQGSISNNNANNNKIPNPINYENWTTDDLVSYICSIADGKFCDAIYDTFKAGLFSMGINGATINMLLYDTEILRDIGLKDENDIIILQQHLTTLYDDKHIKYNNNDNNNNNDEKLGTDDDFFPIKWKFTTDDVDTIKNHHYVGEKLVITSKHLTKIAATVIYVENNWIVVEYNKNEYLKTSACNSSDNLSAQRNIYKNVERLDVITHKSRISKMNYISAKLKTNNNKNNNGIETCTDNIFETEKEYYGFSCRYSSKDLISGDIPECYIDPITYEIMKDPVTSSKSGRTYDKSMIVKHIGNYGTDPFSLQPMTVNELNPNKLLKRAIDRWIKNNPNYATTTVQ